jgi:DNA repair exonuclease SbcCD ATPase subunit
MELYMGKIIALANELLKLLFQGQFEIKPFVINESEFRIPCLGNGYLNDDISSMSSSQIGMISMILSFALLHHSSRTYNIIKLDEIDGPLDYTNRVYFMDVLNSIMDIMHTEQCIMISHNSELQVDNSDVILLKHDETNSDYNRGNIIWSYS